MNSDGEALIRQAAAGDRQAFARLVESHYMTVYKAAYKWTGKREDAEDIAQDVFVKLPGKLAGFRGDAAFSTWLYRLTINAAKDYYRMAGKARGRELPFAEGFDPPSHEVAADRQLAARQALAAVHALPDGLRDAVLLVFGEDMNHKEAAAVLGCTEVTVSWRIFQARKRLKTVRDDYAG